MELSTIFFLLVGFLALLKFADVFQWLAGDRNHLFGPMMGKFLTKLGLIFVFAAAISALMEAFHV